MLDDLRIIFWGILVTGFLPVVLLLLYCLLTGRLMALFSNSDESNAELLASPVIRCLMRAYLLLLPIYVVLLVVYAVRQLS